MTTIVLRATKGSALTNVEVDANFTNLDTNKVEKSSGTGSALVPVGTTLQRDAVPTAGAFRFNSNLGQFEGYNGTAWVPVDGERPEGFRRRNINGAMTIAQAGTSFPAAAGYTLDGYSLEKSSAAVVTIAQSADVPADLEFSKSLSVTVTTADAAIAATDYALLDCYVEGYDARDLIGRDIAINFRVRSPKTGTHCLSIRNSGFDRNYIKEYTVNAANTWETKRVVISGGLIAAGSWDWANGAGIRAQFVLNCGTTYQGAEDAWLAGVFLATASQVNCLDTIGNIFAVTGVQIGPASPSGAEPFEHRSYADELRRAQRYYRNNAKVIGRVSSTATNIAITEAFQDMRAPPTAALLTTTPYAESPIFETPFNGVASTIVSTHLTNASADLLISGFSGLTAAAMCMFEGNQIAYSARL